MVQAPMNWYEDFVYEAMHYRYWTRPSESNRELPPEIAVESELRIAVAPQRTVTPWRTEIAVLVV